MNNHFKDRQEAMYSNFLSELCIKEGLTDIGIYGKTMQSSFSIWSKNDDSFRAVSQEVFDDFAFHTDKEQNPWWEIEWEEAIKLKYIIINNRKRKPFDELAIPLNVRAITDTGKNILLYSGKLLFGSLPISMPLILPLNQTLLIKKIRIELADFNFLHLCNINFLRKKTLQEEKNKLIFISNAIDGLGERLRALMNIMSHAEKYNGEFLFSWKNWNIEHLAMEYPQNIFAKEFLDEHYIDSEYIKKELNLVSGRQFKDFDFDSLKKYDGILLEQSLCPYKNFFEDLKFSEQIKNVKNLAMNCNLPTNLVAIHIRTGDIVYGMWKYSELFYVKTQPVYMLEYLIEKLKKEGFSIILVSLEKEVCKYLSRKYNILYAAELMKDGFNETEKAFFEMFLLSRCDKIIAKRSGFAILPHLVSNNQLIGYNEYLTQDELIYAFRTNSLLSTNYVSNELKAFTISHFLDEFFDKIELQEKIALVNLMVSFINNNYYYNFIRAIVCYQNKDLLEADRILLPEIESGNINKLANNFYWRKYSTLGKYLNYFLDASSLGSIVATIIVLINDHYSNKPINIKYYQDIIDGAYSRGVSGIPLKILEQKLNEFTVMK